MIPWYGGLRGCAVDVRRGDGTVQEDSLEDEVLPRCREDVEYISTVAINVANTHRYKPQSCRSPDDGCFPEITRTAMIRKYLQERAPRESERPERSTRESELPGYQAENPTEVIPPHTYVRYNRTDTYEIYDTQEQCY